MIILQSFVEPLDSNGRNAVFNKVKGFSGYTPLHEAVAGNHPSVVSYLIKSGANVNVRAKYGYTSLHIASRAGYRECLMVLLENSADLTLQDNYGKTPRQSTSKPDVIRLLRSEGKVLCTVAIASIEMLYC